MSTVASRARLHSPVLRRRPELITNGVPLACRNTDVEIAGHKQRLDALLGKYEYESLQADIAHSSSDTLSTEQMGNDDLGFLIENKRLHDVIDSCEPPPRARPSPQTRHSPGPHKVASRADR